MSEIDTKALYGRYEDAEDERQKLHMKVVHKALNIPMEEPVNVTNNTTTTNQGIGWKGLLAIAAGLGIPAAVGVYGVSQMMPKGPTPPAVVSPADSEYEVRFYDKDGNLIQVPRKPAN